MSLTLYGRDPVVLASVVLYFVLAIPLFLTGLSPESRAVYSSTCTTLPFLILAIAGFQWRLRQRPAREQAFWNLLSLAAASWIAQQLMVIADLFGVEAFSTGFGDDLAFVALYLFLVLAIDLQPHRLDDLHENGSLGMLRRIGTVIFLFGVLVYLVVVPAKLDPEGYFGGTPSFVMYGMLDLYLIARVAGPLGGTVEAGWQRVYRCLLATFSLWFVLDTIEGLTWAEVLPWLPDGSPWDMIWMLAPAGLVVTSRVRSFEPVSKAGKSDNDLAGPSYLGGPLVLTAMLMPILHFSVYSAGIFAEGTRQAHEAVTFSVLLILGSLVLIYQRILEGRNRQLERQRRQALALVEQQASHDVLTELPNRRLLRDRLGQAIARAERRDEKLAVIFFDLDGFKAINDVHGHSVGDEVLSMVGRRLVSSVRSADTVARFGGDEFIVLVSEVEDRTSAENLAKKIRENLCAPFECSGGRVSIGASFGLSLYPEDATDLESLLAQADRAMYGHKQARLAGDSATASTEKRAEEG